MLGFKNFITRPLKSFADKSRVHSFLLHLMMPSTKHTHPDLHTMTEAVTFKAHPVANVIRAGADAMPAENPIKRMKAGFHSAFPEGESDAVTKLKAQQAKKHFSEFMTKRGGHKEGYAGDLTVENGKTKLSSGVGVKTIGVSMAPHTKAGMNGYNVCPRASTECAKNCLGVTAGGNKQFPEHALRRKVLVTQYAVEHPEHFARLLDHEIGKHTKAAHKLDMKPGVRLNITSDLPYEHLMPHKFFEKHHEVQFYDYTKIHKRLDNPLPKNYALALSHTGANHAESNDGHAAKALEKGHVVAMVYQRGKHVPKPTHVEDVKTGKRYPLVDGDSDDNVYDRHANINVGKHVGVVSGLKLKGVKNEAAGHFANTVNPDGIIRINK